MSLVTVDKSVESAYELFPGVPDDSISLIRMRAGLLIWDVFTRSSACPSIVYELGPDQIEDFAIGYAYKKALVFQEKLEKEGLLNSGSN